jgi:hypothetical protein
MTVSLSVAAIAALLAICEAGYSVTKYYVGETCSGTEISEQVQNPSKY